MQREDTLPWYRQFWPWFIIALPASAVVAGLYTVWIAVQTEDSLVYSSDEGLDVVTERNLAAARAATVSGIAANIRIDPETGAIAVTLVSDTDTLVSDTDVGLPASLLLQMLHPTLAARDTESELVKALPDADGRPTWAGHFVDFPAGRYYAVLSAGDDWRLSGEWSGETELRLGAPAGDVD